MKTLIVDDEPIARRVLREGLELLPDIEVIGEADNGRSALDQIEKLRPELVFLDLQMPVLSGFEVVRNLAGKNMPIIVIVTAFDQHAVEAFEAGGRRLSPQTCAGRAPAKGRGARSQSSPPALTDRQSRRPDCRRG
ncbi:MAG: response regulator [Ignavibacteriota bacterium]